jgi:hypothetical protein
MLLTSPLNSPLIIHTNLSPPKPGTVDPRIDPNDTPSLAYRNGTGTTVRIRIKLVDRRYHLVRHVENDTQEELNGATSEAQSSIKIAKLESDYYNTMLRTAPLTRFFLSSQLIKLLKIESFGTLNSLRECNLTHV